MKRFDRIKLQFTRNWKFPGKERLSGWFKPSKQLRFSLKNGIIWLNEEDIAINANADNYIEWCIISGGTYEDEIGKLIKISLKPGYIALDIGANIGLHSLRMSRSVGESGKVYAFEPLLYLQEKFVKNMHLNHAENITLLPFALSDIASETNFKINKNAWNQGTFNLSDVNTGNDIQKVIIKIADDIDEIKDLPRLDMVKIDVEGFEFNVIKGLTRTLQKHKPRIIFEYDSNYWLKAGKNINDCFSFLQSLNYKFYQVTQVGCEYIDNSNTIESGNIFCINEK
jgi:FkbM family methyltransferase